MALTVGNVNTVSSKFLWVINKSCLDCKNVKDCLDSLKCTAMMNDGRNIQFHLRLYPKSESEDSKDYVSIYLCASEKVIAKGNIAILNNKGEIAVNHILEECEFDGKKGWGNPKFVSRDFIVNPANKILNDDKITFVCKITIPAYEKMIEVNKEIKKQNTDVLLELIDKYEGLLNDSEFSDVSLISEGKAMKVHKCILAKSSSVFAAMFNAEMKEKQENTVEIIDIKYDVLLEMVRFIYAGKVNNIDTLAGELAAAADKYALDGLMTVCETSMIINLSIDNVIECLKLADKLRMDKLKEKAIELIVENGSDVIDKPEFELLPCEIVVKVCRSMGKKGK